MTLKRSYFTDAERIRLSFEPFAPGDPPIGYVDVSRTQLSLARHSGHALVNGRHYTHFPASDELWRDDIVQMVHRWRKEDAKAARAAKNAAPPHVQGELL